MEQGRQLQELSCDKVVWRESDVGNSVWKKSLQSWSSGQTSGQECKNIQNWEKEVRVTEH